MNLKTEHCSITQSRSGYDGLVILCIDVESNVLA